MKKINITINGTIGVGKTTILDALAERIRQDTQNVIVQPEPSVTIPFINDVLKKFYTDNMSWSYPLQLLISGAQEAYMQQLRESDYDFALMDMAFSSDIYSYSHQKHGRMNLWDHYNLLNVGRPFKFDYVIWINEDAKTTKERIQTRNTVVKSKNLKPGKKDLEIDNMDYIDEHIKDFKEYEEVYFQKFRTMNPNVAIIKISKIPDKDSEDFKNLIERIYKQISTKKNI